MTTQKTENLAMVNDDIVPYDQASISIHDGGVYFGDGAYEVLRLCQGHLFARGPHMARFEYSLEELGMSEKVDLDQIDQRIDQALEKSNLKNGILYFQVTRDRQTRGLNYTDDWQPNFLLTLRKTPPRETETIRAITHPDWRWKRCDIKSLNLLANVMAKNRALQSGLDDAILVNEHGRITEATANSVMMIRGKELLTAPLTANVLPSITRALILEIADSIGLTAIEQPFTVQQALDADELLVAGTTTEIMGVIELDGNKIGSGEKGPYSTQLHEKLYDAMHRR